MSFQSFMWIMNDFYIVFSLLISHITDMLTCLCFVSGPVFLQMSDWHWERKKKRETPTLKNTPLSSTSNTSAVCYFKRAEEGFILQHPSHINTPALLTRVMFLKSKRQLPLSCYLSVSLQLPCTTYTNVCRGELGFYLSKCGAPMGLRTSEVQVAADWQITDSKCFKKNKQQRKLFFIFDLGNLQVYVLLSLLVSISVTFSAN